MKTVWLVVTEGFRIIILNYIIKYKMMPMMMIYDDDDDI